MRLEDIVTAEAEEAAKKKLGLADDVKLNRGGKSKLDIEELMNSLEDIDIGNSEEEEENSVVGPAEDEGAVVSQNESVEQSVQPSVQKDIPTEESLNDLTKEPTEEESIKEPVIENSIDEISSDKTQQSIYDKSLLIKFMLLHIILALAIVGSGIYGGYLGLNTGEYLFLKFYPRNWWPVEFTFLLLGTAVYSAVFFKLAGFLKDNILHIVEFGTVYTLAVDGCNSISMGIAGAVREFKSTGGVTIVFKAVNHVLGKIRHSENLPECLQWILNFQVPEKFQKIANIVDGVLDKTMESMSSCVLAYCYRNDDGFIEELTDGLYVFLKQSVKVAKKVTSALAFGTIVEIVGVICIAWCYLVYFEKSVVSALLVFIIIRLYMYLIQDEFTQAFVKYMAVLAFLTDIDEVNTLDEDMTTLKSSVASIIDIPETLKKFGLKFRHKKETNKDRQDVIDTLDEMM